MTSYFVRPASLFLEDGKPLPSVESCWDYGILEFTLQVFSCFHSFPQQMKETLRK